LDAELYRPSRLSIPSISVCSRRPKPPRFVDAGTVPRWLCGTDLMNQDLFEFNFWVIPPLVSLVALFVLGAVALLKGKGQKANLLFAGICVLGGLLSLDKALGSIVTDPGLALRISRADHRFVVFFVPLYLHFTFAFLGIKKQKGLLVLAYAISVGLSLVSQHDCYLKGVKHYFFGYYALGGPLARVFGLVSSANTLYCLYLLSRRLSKEKDPFRKNKTKYIVVGLGGAALMAHFDFLPVVGIESYPLGNFAFVPLLILGFGVLKHDLLDIGFVFQKSLFYSVLTGLVTGSYALLIIGFNHLFKGIEHRWSFLFSMVFFVVIVFVFDPLKKKVQCIVDRFLFKGKYDYQKTLRALSDAMASMLNLEEIMDKTLGTLTDTMYLDWSYIMLMDNGGQLQVRSHAGRSFTKRCATISGSRPLIRVLGGRKKEVSRSSLAVRLKASDDPDALQEDFDRLGGAAVIPMVCKGVLNGLLVLGNKKSGDLFTGEDFELLCTLGTQCAVAVENAKAYALIENLNANLEAMVEQRTVSLRHALEEKDRTQELLIRSESLAAVGALVAGVAHELNNPLTSVSSLVQSAVETLEDNANKKLAGNRDGNDCIEELVDDLRFSRKELGRAKDIVASLLGISRQSNEYCEPVLLNHVVKNALRVLYNQYKNAGIKIIEDYAEDLPEVRGNFANLGQVCLNIITNAIQAVTQGAGEIVVKTAWNASGAQVVFECRDNGPGISKTAMHDIFKPFFTTKEVGEGTGLGLYISYEIVRRHHGNIVATNAPQGGAVFRVELPT
jgi:two-component system, NtrC family, sensor kinase